MDNRLTAWAKGLVSLESVMLCGGEVKRIKNAIKQLDNGQISTLEG